MLIRLFQQTPISSIGACRAQRFRKPCARSVGRDLLQACLDESVFRHGRPKQPTKAFQILFGLGTGCKSTTYKEMRDRRTYPIRQAKADPTYWGLLKQPDKHGRSNFGCNPSANFSPCRVYACRLEATICRPLRRTIYTPFSAFVWVIVSGFVFSMFSGLGGGISALRSFTFNKLPG